MTKIALSSMKGGVGKTTLSIMIATNLAARGYKVAYWDGDTNNSGTMFFTSGIEGIEEMVETHNIFEALSHNSVENYAIPSKVKNIDIVPSHLNIFKLRGIGYNEMQKTLKTVEDKYDFVIIDTAPSYDNLIINALTAADVILTPLRFTSFDFSTAKFLQKQLYDDCPAQVDKWYLVYSYWEERWVKFSASSQSQFVNLFENTFSNILDIHIPNSKAAYNYTQLSGAKLSINNPITTARLLAAEVNRLVDMLCGSSDNAPQIF